MAAPSPPPINPPTAAPRIVPTTALPTGSVGGGLVRCSADRLHRVLPARRIVDLKLIKALAAAGHRAIGRTCWHRRATGERSERSGCDHSVSEIHCRLVWVVAARVANPRRRCLRMGSISERLRTSTTTAARSDLGSEPRRVGAWPKPDRFRPIRAAPVRRPAYRHTLARRNSRPNPVPSSRHPNNRASNRHPSNRASNRHPNNLDPKSRHPEANGNMAVTTVMMTAVMMTAAAITTATTSAASRTRSRQRPLGREQSQRPRRAS